MSDLEMDLLDFLVSLSGLNRSDVIRQLVRREFEAKAETGYQDLSESAKDTADALRLRKWGIKR
jgi:hypothetical protein